MFKNKWLQLRKWVQDRLFKCIYIFFYFIYFLSLVFFSHLFFCIFLIKWEIIIFIYNGTSIQEFLQKPLFSFKNSETILYDKQFTVMCTLKKRLFVEQFSRHGLTKMYFYQLCAYYFKLICMFIHIVVDCMENFKLR